ncbi:hypothetical protein HDZ31DRAFT_68351 [Schizophyllum fasciatum]
MAEKRAPSSAAPEKPARRTNSAASAHPKDRECTSPSDVLRTLALGTGVAAAVLLSVYAWLVAWDVQRSAAVVDMRARLDALTAGMGR